MLYKEWAMPRTNMPNEHAANERPRPQLRRACEAAARSRERASREATAEFEDDGLHSIHMLSSLCDV
jgi:hypothetical protein